MLRAFPSPEPAVPNPARVAVLASGGGSNLQALVDRCRRPDSAAGVVLVMTNRPGAGALARAEAAGIPTATVDPRTDDAGTRMCAVLAEHRIEWVVLAGYLSLIPPEVVAAFRGRMINIHPALLPAFGGRGMYGLRVHRAVLESGATVSGATVHWVDDRYDEGRILAQWPVPVHPADSPESLAARVLAVEHRLLPAVVQWLAAGQSSSGTPCSAFAPGNGPPDEADLRALLQAPSAT